MADENKGVVMGTAGLNPTQLFSATREVFRASTAAPRAAANTGVACPNCKENGVLLNPVISTADGLKCNMGHVFKDTMELLGRPHDTVPVAHHKVIQENWVPFQIQIPSNVLQALQAKYNDPEKIKAAFAALAQRLIEDNTIIIPELEVKRLSDACGAPIRSATELYGVIKGQQQQISDLQDEVKVGGPAPSTGGGALRRGELILWFDPPTTASLIEKAKSAGRRLEEFLEAFIGQANENNWF
jgi:hypothetical protein